MRLRARIAAGFAVWPRETRFWAAASVVQLPQDPNNCFTLARCTTSAGRRWPPLGCAGSRSGRSRNAGESVSRRALATCEKLAVVVFISGSTVKPSGRRVHGKVLSWQDVWCLHNFLLRHQNPLRRNVCDLT